VPIPTKVLTIYGIAMMLLGALGLRKTWSAFRQHALPADGGLPSRDAKRQGNGCFILVAALLSLGCVILGLVVMLAARPR
jgi:hypothetical protein